MPGLGPHGGYENHYCPAIRGVSDELVNYLLRGSDARAVAAAESGTSEAAATQAAPAGSAPSEA